MTFVYQSKRHLRAGTLAAGLLLWTAAIVLACQRREAPLEWVDYNLIFISELIVAVVLFVVVGRLADRGRGES